jgi:hypothetical protein
VAALLAGTSLLLLLLPLVLLPVVLALLLELQSWVLLARSQSLPPSAGASPPPAARCMAASRARAAPCWPKRTASRSGEQGVRSSSWARVKV